MNYYDKYNVTLSEIDDNRDYEYDYIVDNEFFEKFENDEIYGGNLTVKAVVNKKNKEISIEIRIKGYVNVICDRCIDIYAQPIVFDDFFYFKQIDDDAVEDEKNDEIIYLSTKKNKINLAQIIYEASVFSLPIKRIHLKDENGNSTCNSEMIEKLNKYIINSSETEEEDYFDEEEDYFDDEEDFFDLDFFDLEDEDLEDEE
jgi:uncharacterized metal-binding protein YceD (DUF177 family)